jgi:hypothetical protein
MHFRCRSLLHELQKQLRIALTCLCELLLYLLSGLKPLHQFVQRIGLLGLIGILSRHGDTLAKDYARELRLVVVLWQFHQLI